MKTIFVLFVVSTIFIHCACKPRSALYSSNDQRDRCLEIYPTDHINEKLQTYLESILNQVLIQAGVTLDPKPCIIHYPTPSKEYNVYAYSGVNAILFSDNTIHSLKYDDDLAAILSHELEHIIKEHSTTYTSVKNPDLRKKVIRSTIQLSQANLQNLRQSAELKNINHDIDEISLKLEKDSDYLRVQESIFSITQLAEKKMGLELEISDGQETTLLKSEKTMDWYAPTDGEFSQLYVQYQDLLRQEKIIADRTRSTDGQTLSQMRERGAQIQRAAQNTNQKIQASLREVNELETQELGASASYYREVEADIGGFELFKKTNFNKLRYFYFSDADLSRIFGVNLRQDSSAAYLDIYKNLYERCKSREMKHTYEPTGSHLEGCSRFFVLADIIFKDFSLPADHASGLTVSRELQELKQEI